MPDAARPLDEIVVRGRRRSSAVRRVRELLRTQAVQQLQRGDLLPSEWELMARFNASRGVIRAALELLRDEGLIDRLQGAGTFVVSPHRETFAIDDLTTITRNVEEFDARSRWELLEFEELDAPPLVAQRLGLAEGAGVIFAERRGLFDGEPYHLRESWIPAHLVDVGILDPAAQRMSPDAFLEKSLGGVINRMHVRIEATVSDPVTSGVLGIREGRPLILLERLSIDDHDQPVEFGHSRLRGDRVALTTVMQPTATTHDLPPVPRTPCNSARARCTRTPSPGRCAALAEPDVATTTTTISDGGVCDEHHRTER